MFDPVTCARLQRLITDPSQYKDDWYTIWHGIIVQLFPISRNYAYWPLHRIAKDKRHTPYLAYEVSEFIALPATRRSVLIVVIMESSDWRACVPSLEEGINRLTDDALSGTLSDRATSKVFWIGTIGHHWRYGVKEDNGREMKPLIDWHETIHDEASFDDFQRLVALVADIV